MTTRITALLGALALGGGLLAPSVAPAATASSPAAEARHSGNLRHVATLAYERRYGQDLPFGTDIELKQMRVGGKNRNLAFAGTYRNGLQIINVTRPRNPRVIAVYDCAIAQGDVQVFTRKKRTYVAYTADNISSETVTRSRCYRDIGYSETTHDTRYGTFIADVTNPRRPRTAGFVPLAAGSHNQTVHPNGRFFYNSNSDIANLNQPAPTGKIEVFDVRDFAKPKLVKTLDLGPGLNSHDITFNASGTRAYSAALTQTLVLDTTKPADPTILGRILDPTINIHHQSDPVTIDDPLLGKRRFLVVTDELAGAAGNGFCPGGGLHVFDITGDLEAAPVKVGFWEIPETRPAGGGEEAGGESLRCTSHVLRMHPKKKIMTIAWYNAGVRVVDISGLAGVAVGVTPDAGNAGAGMKEIGFHYFPNSDTWSAKTNKFSKDGSFYLFGNDINRGLDVFRFDAKSKRSSQSGTWLTPAQYRARLDGEEFTGIDNRTTFCLLPTLGG